MSRVVSDTSPTSRQILTDCLLVQCGGDVSDVLPLVPPDAGIISSGASAIDALMAARAAGFPGPVIADRRRYAGQSRVMAGAAISPRWLDIQRRVGVSWAATDSGYVAAGDTLGLINILESAARLGPDVLAILPLHPRWLQDDCQLLITEVLAHSVPIAVAIEHRGDPFSVRKILSGYVRLLRQFDAVVQLSSDISALGALAFGAVAAAVGVRPSLRHLYPAGGGGYRRPVEAVLFDPGLAFVHVDKLARGVAAMPEDPMWVCDCDMCVGRRMDWLLFASEYEQRSHTFDLLARRHSHVIEAPRGAIREQVWRAMCASAEFQFTSVAVAKVGWEVPPALRHWQMA